MIAYGSLNAESLLHSRSQIKQLGHVLPSEVCVRKLPVRPPNWSFYGSTFYNGYDYTTILNVSRQENVESFEPLSDIFSRHHSHILVRAAPVNRPGWLSYSFGTPIRIVAKLLVPLLHRLQGILGGVCDSEHTPAW